MLIKVNITCQRGHTVTESFLDVVADSQRGGAHNSDIAVGVQGEAKLFQTLVDGSGEVWLLF